jgi:hypothetical protein
MATARRRSSEAGGLPCTPGQGYDWTLRFQTIADARANLPANGLILDSEAVISDSRGVPDLGLLHTDLAADRGVKICGELAERNDRLVTKSFSPNGRWAYRAAET